MRTRHGVAVALVIAASLLAFLSLPALWLNRQVLNTDNWTATSSELLADPVIRDQVGVYLVDQLYANVDVTEEIRAALPPRLQPLAQPAAGGLRTLAERASKEILARPRAQQAWETANRAAHEQLLKILDGGGPNVSTTNGEVVLDLKGLLTQLADRLGFGGRLAAAVPPDAAQLTVLRSDNLAAAQDGAKILRHLPLVLLGLSLALFGIALLVAPANRRTTVRGYGAGLIAAGAVMLIVIRLAGDGLVGALAKTSSTEPVVAHMWAIITPLLREATWAGIAYGLVMVVGAWLAGPTRPAYAIRRALAPYLREPLIAYTAFAAVALVVVWWEPTPALRNPVTAVLLIGLLTLGFEALRRRTAREFPDASREEALRAHGLRFAHAREQLFGGRAPATAQGPVSVTQSPAPGEARLDGLERLTRLRDAGAIDAEEFEAEKATLMAAAPAEPPGNGAPAPPPRASASGWGSRERRGLELARAPEGWSSRER